MKKNLFALLSVLVLASLVISACGPLQHPRPHKHLPPSRQSRPSPRTERPIGQCHPLARLSDRQRRGNHAD